MPSDPTPDATPPPPPTYPATLYLQAAADGDKVAADQLLPLVYEQLRKVAQKNLAAERPGHTLQATALVHEVYLRLMGPRKISWANRAHFYRAAADAMRQILIDYARSRGRLKRGGGRVRVDLDQGASLADPRAADSLTHVLAVEEALTRLEARDPRIGAVVRLKFYAGLEVKEVAHALGVSERTVQGDWKFAKAWLTRELRDGGRNDNGAMHDDPW